MKPLYQLSFELNTLMSQIEAHAAEFEGEIPEDLDRQLESLSMERTAKIAGIGRLIKNLKAESEMLKTEKAKLAQRQKVAENTSERVKAYLASTLNEGEKYKDSAVSLSWRKSEGVTILDETLVPIAFCVTTHKPVIADIKKAIKAGSAVPGAELYERQNLTIS